MGHGRIGIITSNQGKLREIGTRLEGSGFELVSVEAPFVEVQADTLEEVVHFGLEHARKAGSIPADLPVFKDDSGLFIDALSGFPGVYSAYVHMTLGCRGILDLMEGKANRSAGFRTVIGLDVPGKGTSLFRGEVPGRITLEERGNNGFGYDPIFSPSGEERTFAEMSTLEKNSISHRIRALDRLLEQLQRGLLEF